MTTQFTNQASTTLSAGLTAVATSATVTDGSVFPATGDFTLLITDGINTEYVLCTARSTNTLTIERGQENTSGTAFSSSDEVILVPTAQSLVNFLSESIPYLQDNTWVGSLTDYDGNVLTSSDFDWVNQDTATATDHDDGSITLYAPGGLAPDELRLLEKDIPSSEPWKVTCAIIPTWHHDSTTTNTIGMGLRDSSTGEFWIVWQAFQSASTVRDRHVASYFTDATTFDSNFADLSYPRGTDLILLQMEYQTDDDVVFRSSAGHRDWITVTTQDANAAGHTFDKVFWFVNAGNEATTSRNRDTYGTLVGWVEEDA